MRWLALALLVAGCWSKPERVVDDGIDNPIEVAAGRKHVCAIIEGHLRCWGKNDHGQLGVLRGADARSGVAMPIESPERTWTWVSAGDAHTCGITDQNDLVCWGDDTNGQIGDGNQTPLAQPKTIMLPQGAIVAKVYAGASATCAIDSDGRLYCWGIYDLDGVARLTPTRVKPGGNDGPWRSVAIGAHHICALSDADNHVYCWGKNMYGELGVADDHDLGGAQPKRDREFVAISAGDEATCGITVRRELVCFGNPARGQIGPADNAPRHEDNLVDGTKRWTGVAVGGEHACAVADNAVYCFGADERGAIGSFEPRLTLPTAPLLAAGRVVAGVGYSCARTSVGVSCWGSNSDGELGNGEVATAWAPFQQTLPFASHVVTGEGHTCTTFDSNNTRELYCWGDNRKGQIAPGGDAFVLDPRHLSERRGLDAPSAGRAQTCERNPVAETQLVCWGANDSNQLGNALGVVELMALPDYAPGDAWINTFAGDSTSCGLDSARRLFCWGDLPGTTHKAQLPQQINGLFTSSVSVGGGVLVAVLTSGETIELGANPASGCGADESLSLHLVVDNSSAPADVAAAAGGQHGCNLNKGTSELRCWGANSVGQAGGAASPCAQPHVVAPPSGKTWADTQSFIDLGVAAGANHTCALTNDHIAYCWGDGSRGEIGERAPSDNTPRAMPGLWKAVVSGPHHMCALASDGIGVACWGENRFGEVGNGKRFHPEPVSVVGI